MPFIPTSPASALRRVALAAVCLAALGGCATEVDQTTAGSGGGDGAGGSPEPVPPSQVYVIDSKGAYGPSRIDGFDSLTSKTWVTYGADQQAFAACKPVLDREGRLLFLDNSPGHVHIVRIDDLSGAGRVTFGDGDFGVDLFAALSGLAVDAADRIYVTDPVRRQIVRVDDMSGNGLTTFGGNEGSGVGEFKSPDGIAISSKGKILVGDWDSARIVEMDDMTGAGWSTFSFPNGKRGTAVISGVAYDAKDRLYAVDFENSLLYRLDAIDGAGLTVFVAPDQLQDVFVHPSGRIYLGFLNVLQAVAQMDDMDGTGFVVYDGPGQGLERFYNPCGIVAR
ncbi:MAG TPA: hypothetical protein VHB21_18800 [Minicystis sp.]|nr:hypothetical protein [Minicystis sp.]